MAINYQPQYRTTGTTTWTNWGSEIAGTNVTFGANPPGPALTAGTSYDFRILADNGTYQTPSIVLTIVTPPTLATLTVNTTTVNANLHPVTQYAGGVGISPYGASSAFAQMVDTSFQSDFSGLNFQMLRIHGGNDTTNIMGTTFGVASQLGTPNWTVLDQVFNNLSKIVNTSTCRIAFTGGVPPTWCNITTTGGQTTYANLMLQIAQRAVLDGIPITYWEVINEPDGTAPGAPFPISATNYGLLHKAVATALKGYNAAYKVGGPVTSFARTDYVNAIYTTSGAVAPDFISFHQYSASASSSTSSPAETFPQYITFWQGQLADPVGLMNAAVTNGASSAIPIYLSEFNMNYTFPGYGGGFNGEPWQQDYHGSAWLGYIISGMFQAVSAQTGLVGKGANLQMVALYDGYQDQPFGIIYNSSGPSPPYTIDEQGLFQSKFTSVMPGNIVTYTASTGTNVSILPTVSGNNISILLVNYDIASNYLYDITLSGFNGTSINYYEISGANPNGFSQAITTASLTSINIPPLSTVFLTGTNVTESVEGLTVTATGATIYASQTKTVADPSGPYNTFFLQTSSGSGLQINFNNGTIQGANVASLVYHDHTLFQSNTSGNWYFWDTATTAYIQFGVTAVALASTTYPSNATAGTIVSAINVTELGDTFGASGLFGGTLTLTDPTGTFTIVGLNLQVATGKTASASSYTISITAQVPAGSTTVGPVVTLSNQVITQSTSLPQGLVVANLSTVNTSVPTVSPLIGGLGISVYYDTNHNWNWTSNTTIQAALKGLGLKLLRLHTGNETNVMTLTFPDASHATYTTATWSYMDTLFNNIPNLFNVSGGTILFTGAHGPSWLTNTAGWAANTTNAQTYATMMAAIAQRAVSHGLYIQYWEPYNEPDASNNANVTAAALGTLHNAVAIALKAVDNTYLVGGPCIDQPPLSAGSGVASDLRTYIPDIVSAAGTANVNFLSWHQYPSGSTSTFATYAADAIGRAGDANLVRNEGVSAGLASNIPLIFGEWNANYNSDSLMQTYQGATFIALYLQGLLTGSGNANMLASAVYDGAGNGTFGVVNVGGSTIYPTGYLLSRLTSRMPGSQVTNTVNSSLANVKVLTTVNGSNFGVMVINYSSTTAYNNTTITLNGYGGSLATVWQMTSTNVNGTTSTISPTNLATTGINLPAISVTIISQS